MNHICETVRRTLEDQADVLEHSIGEHLTGCVSCHKHAALLGVLARVAPMESNPETVSQILTVLPHAPWQRRRLATWLPAVAGLVFAAIGAWLVGAVPGGTVLAFAPEVASAAWGAGTSWVMDAFAAARGGCDVVRMLLAAGGIWVAVWFTVTALGGGWALHALVRTRSGSR